jgi:predicted nucleotidyltransferase
MSDDRNESDRPTGSAPVPDWAAEEIRATWRAARNAGNQLDSFRIIERMVDRLGYGRTENNPSLVPNTKAEAPK